jgi:hypothetical protein
MCRDGIARADPMMVWGRVNLHKTDRKDVNDRYRLHALLLAFLLEGGGDDDDDMDSDSLKTSLLRPPL